MVSRSPDSYLPRRLPSRGLSAVVHLAGIISFSLSFKYLTDHPSFISETYGWHWKFLTILGLAVSYATFVCGLLTDITLAPLPFFIKNKLALCSAPLELLISILYWSLIVIDPRLVTFPEIIITPLADIGFHAMPTIFLTIDFLFLSPPWEIGAIGALALSSTIAVAYWAWVEQCYSHNGFYPYPLFGQLNTIQRVMLFTVAALLMTGSTLVLNRLHRLVNRSGAGVNSKKVD